MKITCVILTVLVLVLGASYARLLGENQSLQQQFAQQQTDFEARLQQERETLQKKIDSLQDFIAFAHNIPPATTTTNTTSNKTTGTINAPDTLGNYVALQQENLERTLQRKYGLLMSRLGLSGQLQTELQQLLAQREQLMNASSIGYYSSQAEIEEAVQRQQEGLAEIDRRITQMLHSPEDRKTYDLLRDSAYEQYQMNNFFDQVQGGVTIPPEKRDALVISKLEQRQEFFQFMETTGASINQASADEKSFLVEKAHQALHDYKDNFLNNARANLTPEQFDALREQEQKQVEEMWQSLKAGWGVN
jgi:hypothetical protein